MQLKYWLPYREFKLINTSYEQKQMMQMNSNLIQLKIVSLVYFSFNNPFIYVFIHGWIYGLWFYFIITFNYCNKGRWKKCQQKGSSITLFSLSLFVDAHDKTFMEVDDNTCTSSNGCDSNAFCACGTVSGIYQCVCKQGYYGAGIPGHCYGECLDIQFYRHLFGWVLHHLSGVLHHN